MHVSWPMGQGLRRHCRGAGPPAGIALYSQGMAQGTSSGSDSVDLVVDGAGISASRSPESHSSAIRASGRGAREGGGPGSTSDRPQQRRRARRRLLCALLAEGEAVRRGKPRPIPLLRREGNPVRAMRQLVVAADERELPLLDELYARSRANGVPGIELGRPGAAAGAGAERGRPARSTLTRDGDRRLPPRRSGLRPRRREPRRGDPNPDDGRRDPVVEGRCRGDDDDRNGRARFVITCGGLHSDRLVRMTGAPTSPRIVRQIGGEVWAGPNAVPAFAREGYRFSRGPRGRRVGDALVPRLPRLARVLLAHRARRDSRRPFEARVHCAPTASRAGDSSRRSGRESRRRPGSGPGRRRPPRRRLLVRPRRQRPTRPQRALPRRQSS